MNHRLKHKLCVSTTTQVQSAHLRISAAQSLYNSEKSADTKLNSHSQCYNQHQSNTSDMKSGFSKKFEALFPFT